MSAEASIWKGVGDGSALLDLWQPGHGPRGGRELVPSGRLVLGLCCDRCCSLQPGLLAPQGPVRLSSSALFAMMTFTQEPPHSCIKTLTRAWGSETLSLSLKLRWPASLLQWIARSLVRPGGPGTKRPLRSVCARTRGSVCVNMWCVLF